MQSEAVVETGRTSSASKERPAPAGQATRWGMFLDAVPYLVAFSVFPMAIVGAFMGGYWVFLPFWTLIGAVDPIIGDNHRNHDVRTPHKFLFFHFLLTLLWVPLIPITFGIVFWQIFYFDHLALWQQIPLTLALGRVMGLSIAVGHDLAHRRSKWERRLAEFVMSFPGLGHYWTEHVYVHHTHVGTPHDPATARRGENIYHFILRSFVGTIASSWRVERDRQHRVRRTMWHYSNPFWRYGLVFAAFIGIAAAIGGWGGVAVYMGAVFTANMSLRGVDYIEHYGLLRLYLGKGRFERAKPHHSWNSSRRLSSYMMFNVQRHSDHHYKPSRAYPLLQTYEENTAPLLPANYIIMYTIAFMPPLWRKIMHPRLDDWRRRFYPQVEDWTAYDSPLYHQYPEKLSIIAEVMKDAQFSAWLHAHPAVLEGKHTPEQAHLSVTDEGFDEDVMAIAQKGLVTLFYRQELSAEEMENQLDALSRDIVDVADAVREIRPWLEDRSFQLHLNAKRGYLAPEDARAAFSRMIDTIILHVARRIDDEYRTDPSDGAEQEDMAFPPPGLHVLDSLARSDMAVGATLRLFVDTEDGKDIAAEEMRFRRDWTRRFQKAMKLLLPDDFPCTLSGSLAGPGQQAAETLPQRQLR